MASSGHFRHNEGAKSDLMAVLNFWPSVQSLSPRACPGAQRLSPEDINLFSFHLSRWVRAEESRSSLRLSDSDLMSDPDSFMFRP